MGKIQISPAHNIGNGCLVHATFENHVTDSLIPHPLLQQRSLVAVSPDQEADRRVRHLFSCVQ